MDRNENHKVLIVFQEPWLAYTPSLLNLRKCLIGDGYTVDMVGFFNPKFKKPEFVDNVEYINEFIVKKGYRYFNCRRIKYLRLCNHLQKYRKISYDMIFGIDDIGYLSARHIFQQVIFYSLELQINSYMKKCLKIGITDMINQTEERAKIILQGRKCNIYCIQNSPIYKKHLFTEHIQPVRKLIYFGSLVESFCIDKYIEMLNILPREYTLELHGVISDDYEGKIREHYSSLFESGRINMTHQYIDSNEIPQYIGQFDIGLCFYDLTRFTNDYNFITCPSGKLFNYYNAGIPVVASHVSGLSSIDEMGAGVTIDGYKPEDIAIAVKKVTDNYCTYREGAINAAVRFDYKMMYRDFINKYNSNHGKK